MTPTEPVPSEGDRELARIVERVAARHFGYRAATHTLNDKLAAVVAEYLQPERAAAAASAERVKELEGELRRSEMSRLMYAISGPCTESESCPTWYDGCNCGIVKRLEAAIRKHRDTRGDDRCYQDDAELYAALPEGDTRPAVDSAVTIENCQRYIACRQDPGREYVSPQRRIDELEAALAARDRECAELRAAIGNLYEPCWSATSKLESQVCRNPDLPRSYRQIVSESFAALRAIEPLLPAREPSNTQCSLDDCQGQRPTPAPASE